MAGHEVAHRFNTRFIVSASVWVFAASLALSVGGFVFHAIASRRLGVADYGALYALISVYAIAVLPVTLVAPVVTKYAAEFEALHDDSHLRGLLDRITVAFLVLGGAYAVSGILFAGPIGEFLHVAAWEIPILGLMCAVGTLSAALRAVGQGVHAYAGYGWSMVGEGVAKVLFLLILSFGALSILRGTSAFLAGMCAGAVIIAVPLAKRYFRVAASPIRLDWRRITASVAGAASLAIATSAMGFGDVIIVKHFFSSDDAGLYSAASLCAKILFYFVGFVPAILIPQATHRHARGQQTRQTLWLSLAFVGGVALLGFVAYRFAGTIALHALVGKAFDGALVLLPWYAGSMGLLALTSTLGSFGIATHRLAFVPPLVVSTLATLTCIALMHPSLVTVAEEVLVGNVVMFASTAIPLGVQGLRTT